MSAYSHREYYEMVRCYILSGESVSAARRMYQDESIPRLRAQGLLDPAMPSHYLILAANQRLLDHGQFSIPGHARGSGGGNPALPVDLEDEILDYFERDPRRSTNDAARYFGVSQYYTWKVLNRNNLHPYKFHKTQALVEGDAASRVTFCEWLLAHQDANILWTDECMFTRVGLYNHRNEHWWSLQNPHVIRDNHHQVRFSANVWAGMIGDRILGPYFIEGRLTGGTYLDMLQGVIEDMIVNNWTK